ncbi:techylectin-5A-like [Centruroides sculpturatus]|uniref:techylectin-5A-like n=1 Tax=Centruroides sculpturatus TaxID=218467 RepID=UPI000C6E6726|nr:techylectin-5A-like [Centruroides sculpturatus]
MLSSVLYFILLNSRYTLIESTCNYQILSQVLNFTEDYIKNAINTVQQEKYFKPGPTDCAEIFKNGHTKSGIYRIWPANWQVVGSFRVYCDMSTEGGGWTVIQRRGKFGNPKNYFYKTWNDYKVGFGNLEKEFWLGKNYLLAMSCTINLASFSPGDSLSYHNEMKFSARDNDNDFAYEDCANLRKGGWWYNSCTESNLNGLNLFGFHTSYADGINWYKWRGSNYSLFQVEMKIRPVV